MKKKRKGWIWLIVIVLLLGLGGGAFYYFYLRDGADANAGTAYVQSVADVTGMGNVGQNALYRGIVEAKDVIEINPQSDMRILKCYVETGSKVREGDPLFAYDVEDLKLQHAQLLIDITGLENGLRTNNEELEQLNKKLERAKESQVYELKLSIQTIELDIKKAEYDLKDKQQKAEDMQALIDASVVSSPVTGTVRSVRDESQSNPFGYYDGQSTAYISIVAGTDYCVKGTVSEQTVRTLYEGMPVLVRSRVDESTYPGTIYKINTDNTESSQPTYYDMGAGDSSSKYAFYVELASIEGLMIGQHVFIDLDATPDEDRAPMLPAAFVMQEDGRFYVWAVNEKNRIERREIQLGAYDEATESYPIVSGLSLKDRIAFPDDTVHAGMIAAETNYLDPDAMPSDFGIDNGMIDNGMIDMTDNGMTDGGMIDMPDDGMGFDSFDLPEEDWFSDDDSTGFGG